MRSTYASYRSIVVVCLYVAEKKMQSNDALFSHHNLTSAFALSDDKWNPLPQHKTSIHFFLDDDDESICTERHK